MKIYLRSYFISLIFNMAAWEFNEEPNWAQFNIQLSNETWCIFGVNAYINNIMSENDDKHRDTSNRKRMAPVTRTAAMTKAISHCIARKNISLHSMRRWWMYEYIVYLCTIMKCRIQTYLITRQRYHWMGWPVWITLESVIDFFSVLLPVRNQQTIHTTPFRAVDVFLLLCTNQLL